jgi:hypothetical protein
LALTPPLRTGSSPADLTNFITGFIRPGQQSNAMSELSHGESPRKPDNRLAKARSERSDLQRAWTAWRKQRIEALCTGEYAEAACELRKLLDRMELTDGAKLIAAIRSGPWASADRDTGHEIFALIDTAIIRLRERNDLPPFDDSVPFSGRPLTVFEIVREALR